jgi:hypothetical protein
VGGGGGEERACLEKGRRTDREGGLAYRPVARGGGGGDMRVCAWKDPRILG